MQRKSIMFIALFLIAVASLQAQETAIIEAITISPDGASVEVGDTVQFSATVTDTADAVVDTTVTWASTGVIGEIDSTGMFTASAAGTGAVIAAVGDIADTVTVTVTEPAPVEPVVGSVTIFPKSHCIAPEDSVQFTAAVKDTAGEDIDVAVTWSVSDTLIGTVDETGLFIPLDLGQVEVIAAVGDIADTAQVTIEEDVVIPPDTNIINVLRIKPDGKVTKFGSYTLEGDTLNIGGIPSPLNFINGTKIIFPENSLEEDITLTFKIPSCGQVHGNDVDFGDTIVNAVTFEVSVDGEPVHPYVFGVPLQVSIPYKHGLLDHRGLAPEDLAMFYVTEDGDLIEEGITDIAVDYENNRITGIVEHFSDIALAPKGSGQGGNDREVTVYPKKQTVAVGDTIQFQAQLADSNGVVDGTLFTWAVENPLVGSVDDTGMFVALAVGETDVFAIADEDSGAAEVTVLEQVIYDPDVNTVNIQRIHPDSTITRFGAIFAEGDTVTIAGIPHPLNFLNGTKLVFAEGTLHENILLTFRIPEFGYLLEDQVTFDDEIVTAVTFEVTVDDEVQHPYYFDQPIEVSLPYKRGLLDNLGIEPEDLGMYFVSQNGELIEEGITNITVDEELNLITGTVEHFSDIALAPVSSLPTAVNDKGQSEYILSSSYPNPFNPVTTISYYIPSTGKVSIVIYNIAGQRVRDLVDDIKSNGYHSVIWDGRTNGGEKATSGVYLYEIRSGSLHHSQKITLMK